MSCHCFARKRHVRQRATRLPAAPFTLLPFILFIFFARHVVFFIRAYISRRYFMPLRAMLVDA